MSDSPLIAQPGKQKMTLLRESYLAICKSDSCAARLLNAMERWHAWKLQVREELRGRNRVRRQGGLNPNNDEDLWVRMAIDPKDGKSLGWKTELMDEYSYKVILRGLDLLVTKGFVLKRENPRQNWDRTPQWLFQVNAVQGAVDAWAANRANPGMTTDPDGTSDSEEEGETQQDGGSDHSADSTECTRQKDRVVSAEKPNRLGTKTELTRQKDRSNNTDTLTQASLTDIPEHAAVPTTLEDNARETEVSDAAADSPVSLTPQAMPATLEVSEALPLSVMEAQAQAGDMNPNATSTEHVPGGAAGRYAILGLTPVPRPVLEARLAQHPEHMPRLRALLNASPRSRLAHLNAILESATQTGGIPRELLTRLTDDELALVAKAAKADAHHPGGFMKFGALALDRMIGAPITREVIEGKRPAREQTLGHAYEVKNEPKKRVAELEGPTPQEAVPEPQDLLRKYRGLWCLRKNPDKVVDVVDVEERPGSTALLYLNDESTLTVATLMLQYQRPAWMQHDASA